MNVGLLIWSVIFMGILYLTCSKYEYFPNVVIYTVGMGLIPALFSFVPPFKFNDLLIISLRGTIIF